MADHVGVFIDGSYLLHSGVETLLSNETPTVIPNRFNVLAFKSAVRSLVDGLLPGSRVLRIYWYEHEAEDEAAELKRCIVLAKNGMYLRTFEVEEDEAAIESTIVNEIIEDVLELNKHQAISDALIVSGSVDFNALLDEVQPQGLRVHFVESSRRTIEETLDLRSKADTFSAWSMEGLQKFILPKDENAREEQNLKLDPDEYDIPDEVELEPVAEDDEVGAANESLALRSSAFPPKLASSLASDVESEIAPTDSYEEDEELTSDLLTQRVRTYIETMNDAQVKACVQYWSSGRNDVPPMHDKSVLGACRAGIQRNLSPNERKIMRDEFMRIANQQFVERNLSIDLQRSTPRNLGPRDSGERPHMSAPTRFGKSFQQIVDTEVDDDIKLDITEFVELSVARLTDQELTQCVSYWQSGEYGVPAEFDKAVMAVCRQELGRVLTEQEKFFMRAEFKRIATEIYDERGFA